jgi:hypothetical protein
MNPVNNPPTDQDVLNLLFICRDIGDIAESNRQYQQRLAERVAETGKPLSFLTVAELLALDADESRKFNADTRIKNHQGEYHEPRD